LTNLSPVLLLYFLKILVKEAGNLELNKAGGDIEKQSAKNLKSVLY
jgi:hypothetical protein